MKIFIDQRKLQNRATLSNLMSIGGLITLLASVILPLFYPGTAKFSFVLMVTGLGVAMVGIYFANRWVRKPRPEDKLDKALKSLNDTYHLYHYPSLPCDHLLITPSGVLILETVGLAGFFSYKKGRWKESMTIGRALRYIVEEHLGDPIRAAREAEGFLKTQLEKLDLSDIPIKSVVVFTHPAVELDIEGATIPVVKVDKLRKQIPTNMIRLDEKMLNQLDEFLEQLTIKR